MTLLAGRLASWLGWDEVRLARLRIGAPLYDIGKVMLSQTILSKPRPLIPNGLAEIRTHPTAGAKLIGPVGPERHAISYAVALAETERCAGSQFDPAFAHAFLQAWDAGAFGSQRAAQTSSFERTRLITSSVNSVVPA